MKLCVLLFLIITLSIYSNCGTYKGLGTSSLAPGPTGGPSPSPVPSPTPSVNPDPVEVALCSGTNCFTPSAAPRVRTTQYSASVEWPGTGDMNYNATAELQYRVLGTNEWFLALPLVRIDFTSAAAVSTKGFYGSIFYLTPNTSYEFKIILREPDGGVKIERLQGITQKLPQMPTGGRTLHLASGTGGTAAGTAANPFRTFLQANGAATPGDTIRIHGGTYNESGGPIILDKSGTESNYIVYKSAGDGEVNITASIEISASFIWLEGLTMRNRPFAIVGKRNINEKGVVIKKCQFLDNQYAIHHQLGSLASHWYIEDNLIDGENKVMGSNLDGEGFEFNQTSDHVVIHNTITHVGDGVSYPGSNVDIMYNDIYDVTDDSVELDFGTSNVRVVGNRLHNSNNNGLSFQPMNASPWYFIRNQLIGFNESFIKFRETDRFVFLHNTVVGWTFLDKSNEESWDAVSANSLVSGIVKNNLFLVANGGKPLAFKTAARFNWRSVLDYNGYYWGAEPNPFRYNSVSYPNLTAFSAATGKETHGTQIVIADCFTDIGIRGPTPMAVSSVFLVPTLGCAAIDKAEPLPNINSSFTGSAPDLGAYEFGVAPHIVGRRP